MYDKLDNDAVTYDDPQALPVLNEEGDEDVEELLQPSTAIPLSAAEREAADLEMDLMQTSQPQQVVVGGGGGQVVNNISNPIAGVASVSGTAPGITISGTPTNPIVNNGGVTNITAGNAGIGVSANTGNVAVSNNGVLSFNGAGGAVTGVSSVTVTAPGLSNTGTAANPILNNTGVTSLNTATGALTAITRVVDNGGVFTTPSAGSGDIHIQGSNPAAGISTQSLGNTMNITNTGVTSLNAQTTAVTLTATAPLTVTSAGGNINIAGGGGGVTSVAAQSGAPISGAIGITGSTPNGSITTANVGSNVVLSSIAAQVIDSSGLPIATRVFAGTTTVAGGAGGWTFTLPVVNPFTTVFAVQATGVLAGSTPTTAPLVAIQTTSTSSITGIAVTGTTVVLASPSLAAAPNGTTIEVFVMGT
jgi:hypothetical protein